MTIYDLVLQWQGRELIILLQMNVGLLIGLFNISGFLTLARSTQTLFSLRGSIIYLLSAAGTMLQLHVPCYRNKLHCFLFFFIVYQSLKSKLCSCHMKTFLPSPVCLINTVLVCLITSPVSDTNVSSKWR